MPTIITWPRSLKIWQLAPKNAGNPIGISFSRGLFSGGYVGFLEGKLYIYIYTLLRTNISSFKGTFESMISLFPKVGYVSSLKNIYGQTIATSHDLTPKGS